MGISKWLFSLVLAEDSSFSYASAAVAVPFAMARNGKLSAQSERVAREAEWLFNRGYASRVVFCGGHCIKGRTEAEAMRMLASNVPFERSDIESASRTTRENAQGVVPILRRRGCHSAILVVQEMQSRRAVQVFRKLAPDITFYVYKVAAPVWDDNAKWSLRHPVAFLVRELLATAYFRLRGWI